jgi:hypothetical protein
MISTRTADTSGVPRLIRSAGLLVAVCAAASVPAAQSGEVRFLASVQRKATGHLPFVPPMPHAYGLVTNEYAHWNPRHPDARRSRVWDMTSGSLFSRAGAGWTGEPDGRSPDARSARRNDSAVFRLNTRRSDFGDVRVSLDLDIKRLVTTPRTPAQDYDGVHIWLRYQSQYHLYVVTIARRDGTVLFKRKDFGGPSNGGTYVRIGRSIRLPYPRRRWFHVAAQARNTRAGVELSMWVAWRLVERVTDRSALAIRKPGAVGIRGDNAEFLFRRFRVDAARG